jgi:hypothetical protein
MKERDILKAYVFYYEALQSLAEFPINKLPTIEQLKLSRGVMQRGYREINDKKLDLTLVEYLCFISTKYVLNEICSQFSLIGLDTKELTIKENDFKNINNRFIDSIFDVFVKKQRDFKNMLKLCVNSPSYFFDSEEFRDLMILLRRKDNKNKMAKDNKMALELIIYQFLTGLWFTLNAEVRCMIIDNLEDVLISLKKVYLSELTDLLITGSEDERTRF